MHHFYTPEKPNLNLPFLTRKKSQPTNLKDIKRGNSYQPSFNNTFNEQFIPKDFKNMRNADFADNSLNVPYGGYFSKQEFHKATTSHQGVHSTEGKRTVPILNLSANDQQLRQAIVPQHEFREV